MGNKSVPRQNSSTYWLNQLNLSASMRAMMLKLEVLQTAGKARSRVELPRKKCRCFNVAAIIPYWSLLTLQSLPTSSGKNLSVTSCLEFFWHSCPALCSVVSVELKGCHHLKLSEMVAVPCWPLTLKNEHKLAKGLELTAVLVGWGSKSNKIQWQTAGLQPKRLHSRGVPRCSFQSRWHNSSLPAMCFDFGL